MSVLTQLDTLRSATTPLDIKNSITSLSEHIETETDYLFPRLIAGLASNSSTTKQNFLTCLLFLTKSHPKVLNLNLWQTVMKEKLDIDSMEDGKRIQRNVCYGRVLAWSLLATLFTKNLDWTACKHDLETIVKQEPLAKTLVYEVYNQHPEKLKFSLDTSVSACPVELALALKNGNKNYIKTLFGSKNIDLAQSDHKALAVSLIQTVTANTHQMRAPPLLTELSKCKNSEHLINELANSKTRNKKKTALDMYLLAEELTVPNQAILACVRGGLYNPELKQAISEDFIPKLVSKLGEIENSDLQLKVFYSFLEFEPMLDQNTRSRNLLKLSASLNSENAKAYISLLIDTCNDKTTSLSKSLPEGDYDCRKYTIQAIENMLVHNKNVSKKDLDKSVKFLVELGFVGSPKNVIAQQSIGVILNSRHVAEKFDVIELIQGVKDKISGFPENIWSLGLGFKLDSMKPLMRILLVKLVELYVNKGEEEANSDKQASLSKHDSVQAELDELTASIQDLASIEQDVRNKVEKSEQGVHWSCVMMEILISIMTKESKLLRKGAVDSFRQIVEDMDVEAITILGKDIMGQEANTEGYGLGVNEEMETDSEDDEEDEEEEDEKEESDEEMMDDTKTDSKSEKNNESDESSEDEAEKNNIDTELRSKLQAVLGDSDGSSNAGSDMDEEMVALDSNLSRIFRERKKHTHKRQKQELASQANNFRIRLLDFVEVLASSRFAGIGLNRDQTEPSSLAVYLAILTPGLAYSLKTSNVQLFQRAKSIIQMVVKRKFNNVVAENITKEASVDFIKENTKKLVECLASVTSNSMAGPILQLLSFNLKIMNRLGSLDTELLSELFSKDAVEYITKRSSNFTVVLMQDIPERFPEFSAGIISEVLKSLGSSCHKSRTIKALNVASKIGAKIPDAEKSLAGVDEVLVGLVEKFKSEGDLLFCLVKCAKVLKFDGVIAEVKKVCAEQKMSGKFNRVKSMLENCATEAEKLQKKENKMKVKIERAEKRKQKKEAAGDGDEAKEEIEPKEEVVESDDEKAESEEVESEEE